MISAVFNDQGRSSSSSAPKDSHCLPLEFSLLPGEQSHNGESSFHHCPSLVTSSCDTESVSSLSSIEDSIADESEASSSSKARSIFRCYWDKTGSSPEPRPRRHSAPPLSGLQDVQQESDDDSSSTSSINYERTLRQNEGVSRNRRRSIFGGCVISERCTNSMPSLRDLSPGPRRKTRSSSDLSASKLPSCLKSKSPGRKRSNSNVSFGEVSIVEFNRPQERWAADGWSSWFH